jgi:hypothetical protein
MKARAVVIFDGPRRREAAASLPRLASVYRWKWAWPPRDRPRVEILPPKPEVRITIWRDNRLQHWIIVAALFIVVLLVRQRTSALAEASQSLKVRVFLLLVEKGNNLRIVQP